MLQEKSIQKTIFTVSVIHAETFCPEIAFDGIMSYTVVGGGIREAYFHTKRKL